MFDETRKSLEKLGLPTGDLYELTTSGKTFPDGAHYRIEVPTVNSFDALKALVDRADELGVTINRVDETYGIFRHTLGELRDSPALARERGIALNLAVGPRAPYDTGATVHTSQGVRIAYRLRGMEQVVRAIEDVKRAVSVGCRGILVYDEGLLWVLAEMRKVGDLPEDLHYKVSAHCGHANPASFQMLERLGANTINPVRDLQLPMLGALRRAVSVPLDLHTDNPPASGGFIRSYEAPEIARVASPVYLKTGNSAVSGHGIRTTAAEGRAMAEQASIIVEMVSKYLPDAVQSQAGAFTAAVPV